jgi:hypothetical protein
MPAGLVKVTISLPSFVVLMDVIMMFNPFPFLHPTLALKSAWAFWRRTTESPLG